MKNQYSLKFALPVFMSFYVMGFVDLVGVATGYVKQDFELSDTVAQLLPSLVFVWFALLAIPTGLFQDRKGKRITVNIGMIITGVGMLFPLIYYSYFTVILGFMIIGIGNTILQVSANPLLLDVSSPNTKAANLSLSQFIKAIASMLGPIITAALASYTGNWKLIFPVYAVISLLAVIWLYSVKVEESKSDKEPATLKSVFKLLQNKFIFIIVLGIFVMVGFDVSMNSNIANFLSNRFEINLETASIGISIYFAALMVGRFLGAILLRKININLFLIVSVVLNLLGLVGILLSNDLNIARIMIFIAGLGFSNVFPLFFALAVEKRPDYANEISGLIILAVCGGAVIPPIAGIFTDMYGVNAIIYILIACILYVSFASYYIVKDSNKVVNQ
jgi:MFS transporter, FHS family, L-fucose permease